MRNLLILLILIGCGVVNAAPSGECEGTPNKAVTELPNPLNIWGQILCTPYGHIITNREGWIWTNPGGYSPVMIPSQMVRKKPKPLGNHSYFTEIEMTTLAGEDAEKAIELFQTGFDSSESTPTVYSLNVVSISGKSLSFQFFDFGNNIQWGMWCNRGCDLNSRFMMLNMNKSPNKALQSTDSGGD